MSKIIVLAEQQNGKRANATRNAITAAKQLGGGFDIAVAGSGLLYASSRTGSTGKEMDLEMEELSQRVAGTLKKYLNKDFDWDSQRYRLAGRV